MRHVLRRSALLMLTVLPVAGLTVIGTSTPEARADNDNSPSIAADPGDPNFGPFGYIHVVGDGFTPDTTVQVVATSVPTTTLPGDTVTVEGTATTTVNSQGYIETDVAIDHCVGTDLWHFYNGAVSLVASNTDVAGEHSDSKESHAINPGPPASCAG